MTMLSELRQRFDAWWHGTREYRYEGEQSAHAEQLRETQVALSLMANATNDPDQQRMATDIEDGSEKRLKKLLERPILTLEEKRERDAIQAALAERRRSFDLPTPAVDAPPAQTQVRGIMGAPRRFFGSVATIGGGWQVWAIAAAITLSGWGTAAVQAAIKERIEDQRDAARDAIEDIEEQRDDWKRRAEAYAQAVADARQAAQQSAAALEAERAAQARAAARERRRQREVQNVLANSPEPPAWSLRDDESVPQ
jgi:hypothetical protein